MTYNIPPGFGVSDLTGTNDDRPIGPNRGYEWDSSYSSKWRKAGKEIRREISHLKHPIYTDEITMSSIIFSAEPFGNENVIRSKLGHNINVQFELYGCSNYDLDRSKLLKIRKKIDKFILLNEFHQAHPI